MTHDGKTLGSFGGVDEQRGEELLCRLIVADGPRRPRIAHRQSSVATLAVRLRPRQQRIDALRIRHPTLLHRLVDELQRTRDPVRRHQRTGRLQLRIRAVVDLQRPLDHRLHCLRRAQLERRKPGGGLQQRRVVVARIADLREAQRRLELALRIELACFRDADFAIVRIDQQRGLAHRRQQVVERRFRAPPAHRSRDRFAFLDQVGLIADRQRHRLFQCARLPAVIARRRLLQPGLDIAVLRRGREQPRQQRHRLRVAIDPAQKFRLPQRQQALRVERPRLCEIGHRSRFRRIGRIEIVRRFVIDGQRAVKVAEPLCQQRAMPKQGRRRQRTAQLRHLRLRIVSAAVERHHPRVQKIGAHPFLRRRSFQRIDHDLRRHEIIRGDCVDHHVAPRAGALGTRELPPHARHERIHVGVLDHRVGAGVGRQRSIERRRRRRGCGCRRRDRRRSRSRINRRIAFRQRRDHGALHRQCIARQLPARVHRLHAASGEHINGPAPANVAEPRHPARGARRKQHGRRSRKYQAKFQVFHPQTLSERNQRLNRAGAPVASPFLALKRRIPGGRVCEASRSGQTQRTRGS